MWLRLSLGPWWLRTLVYSSLMFCGGAMFLFAARYPARPHDDGPPLWMQSSWWIGVGAVSVALGIVMSASASYNRRHYAEFLKDVSPRDYPDVARAASRGPVPSDPVVRRATAAVVERALNGLVKMRTLMLAILAFNVLIQGWGIVLSLESSDHSGILLKFILGVEFSALAVYYWLYPRVLEARLMALTAPPLTTLYPI